MSHRLFHAIVVSGLVAGCGLVADEREPEPAPDESPLDDTDDAAVPLDAETALRACEPGWATTKGCLSFPAPGVLCCRERCCLDPRTLDAGAP